MKEIELNNNASEELPAAQQNRIHRIHLELQYESKVYNFIEIKFI